MPWIIGVEVFSGQPGLHCASGIRDWRWLKPSVASVWSGALAKRDGATIGTGRAAQHREAALEPDRSGH